MARGRNYIMAYPYGYKIKTKDQRGKLNYRLCAENDEPLYSTNQGFSSKANMIKNIKAVAQAFKGDWQGMEIKWVRNSKSKFVQHTEWL